MREVTARMRIVFVWLVLCGAFVAGCAPAAAQPASASATSPMPPLPEVPVTAKTSEV